MIQRPRLRSRLRSRRGIALVLVLLVMLALAALTLGASMMTMHVGLIAKASERTAILDHLALAGLEEGRSAINGTKTLFPDSAYATLEDGVTLVDATGAVIPNVRRWTYAGPTGITSGQYGILGSVVTVVRDDFGNQVVRRQEVNQESFAKFAYFTDFDDADNIRFGGGDQLFGPVHSNSSIGIYASGATFHDVVTTAGTIIDPANGTFNRGYQTSVPAVPMPTVADLTKLQTQATAGGTAFTGTTTGTGAATTRIEFVAIDLNGNGSTTDADEGFFRVYQGADPAWVTALTPTTGMRNSRNCGDFLGPHNGSFSSAAAHPTNGAHAYIASLSNASKRCFLGGDPTLTNGWVTSNADGSWLPWTGTVDPRLTTLGRADAGFLFPLSRTLNPNFKGVIYVNGHVAISGVLRGRVTLATPNDIVIADDVTYATDPGVGSCLDILGLLAAGNVIVANNTINAPQRPANGQNMFTYDDTKDEFIHGVVLALGQFRVQDHTTGPTNEERCESTNWGRGCLYLTGGIIQATRGPVGTGGGTGNLKRYSYDRCAATDPPPYFPTTGRFARNRVYEIDPTGFSVAAFFAALTPE